MRFIKPIITFLLSFVSFFTSIGQNSNFIEYMIEDGLIMSQIESITQDAEGNLWIGTIGGLSKYDGKTFVNYTQKEGLAEDWVSVVHYSQINKTVWLGHRGGGVSIKKLEDKNFTDLQIEEKTKYNLINAIAEDKNGNIWLAVEKVGLLKYNFSTKNIEQIDDIKYNHISSLCIDANEVLWVGSDNGIVLVDVEKQKVIADLSTLNELPDNYINDIKSAMNREIWVATTNEGIVRFKLPASIENYSSSWKTQKITKDDGLTSNYVSTIYEDHYHNVWIGTHQNGIMQYSPVNYREDKGEFIKGDVNIFSNKFELKYYQANAFFEDREGNVWVGTEYGLLKYLGELFKIYDQHDDLINNLVWSILEDNNGYLWFGTSKGVSKFKFPLLKGKKQYHAPIVKNFTTANGLPDNIIISMCQTKNGDIWMGTERNGVFTINTEGQVKKKLTVANGISSNKIFSIAEDNEGNVWLGTDNGITVIDNQNNITKYTIDDGIGGQKIYSIFKDSKNRMWLGILGGDLTAYENGKFNTFTKEKGVPYKFVTGITEDKKGNLWFAAYSDGVIKYDGNNFEKYSLEHGLNSNSIHFITCDDENNIWVGQSVGVDKFDYAKNRFVFYGKKQGFVGMETNENAVCNDRLGNIWFGTIRGVVKFNPKKDEINFKEPLTKIKSMNLFMNEVDMVEGASFAYDENNFTFFTQGICLTNSDEVYYKYQLQGLSDEWSVPTKDAKFNTGVLPHGNYTFKVVASNNNGVWNESPQEFSFSVNPPFWKTWWFYTILAIIILSSIVSYIKIRERKMLAYQQELEDKVDKRTEELRKEKEIVQAQNANIKESISYARRIQEAILLPQNDVNKILPESFILYKPKDVVSGDFYWIHERNNMTYVAAVDCTGHGVPGAFMSLIGYNILEKVVNESEKLAPNEILNALSKEIAKVLRQDTESSTIKDGMDLALISINKNTNELIYAGAYNPMYIVRNKELTEYKADKIPIGKGNESKNQDFSNINVSLQKGDVIYIFSDGFPDQKGGENHKKYYYKPFRDLLTEISSLPLAAQKEKLNEEFNKWKGNIEQIDDVLVLGIKV